MFASHKAYVPSNDPSPTAIYEDKKASSSEPHLGAGLEYLILKAACPFRTTSPGPLLVRRKMQGHFVLSGKSIHGAWHSVHSAFLVTFFRFSNSLRICVCVCVSNWSVGSSHNQTRSPTGPHQGYSLIGFWCLCFLHATGHPLFGRGRNKEYLLHLFLLFNCQRKLKTDLEGI